MPDTETKTLWPGWETVRLIGRGSFGAVYEIQRSVFGDVERCALKHISIPQNDGEIREMRSEGLDELSITQSFADQAKDIVSEYKLMARLNDCPNVVTCHDIEYIQKDGGYGWDIFIRMELLTPFTELLSERRGWPEDETLRLGRDIASALCACRRLNIVHRDIKPQNIFLTAGGRYKLGDFGVARIADRTSSATARIGTYTYMAPEVFNGERYGAGADIYSLGMVLYWLLNDRRAPFVAVNTAKEKEAAQRRRMLGEPIPAPAHGSDGLKRIVLKACAYDPKDRYQSADELLRELETLLRASAPPLPQQQKPAAPPPDRKPEPKPAAGAAVPTAEDDEATVSGAVRKESPRPEPKKEAPAAKNEEATVSGVGKTEKNAEAETVEAAAVSGRGNEDDEATVSGPLRRRDELAPPPAPDSAATTAPKKKKSPAPAAAVVALVLAAVLLIVLLPKGGKVDAPAASPAPAAEPSPVPAAEPSPVPTAAPTTEQEEPTVELSEEERVYLEAERLAAEGKIYEAATTFYSVRDYRDSWDRCFSLWGTITYRDTTCIRSDGTINYREERAGEIYIHATIRPEHLREVPQWEKIEAVGSSVNAFCGLTTDGNVLTVCEPGYDFPVAEWRDIVAISVDDGIIIGLKADGTVLSAKQESGGYDYGQFDVGDWKDIVMVSTGGWHTVGLKSDGTVVAAGRSDSKQCDVSGWRDVVFVTATLRNTFGVKKDGTVVVAGDNQYGQSAAAGWSDIVEVAADKQSHAVAGLKSDGTVVCSRPEVNLYPWTDIVAIYPYGSSLVGLRANGDLVWIAASTVHNTEELLTRSHDIKLPPSRSTGA